MINIITYKGTVKYLETRMRFRIRVRIRISARIKIWIIIRVRVKSGCSFTISMLLIDNGVNVLLFLFLSIPCSKFVLPDSTRVGLKIDQHEDQKLEAISFLRPDGIVALVVINV